jgi:MauM/NapG family ferredoxin protein
VKEIAKRTEERVVVEQYFRPPGAIDEMAFLAACTRCGKCIDVCPPHAIAHAPSSAGLAAGTPMLDARRQPCTVCPDMPCVTACPTGALLPPANGWTGYHMATLELDLDRCIAFHDVECGVCARACPIGEAALALDDKGRPVLKAEGCVGCGVCVQVCVTTPSSLKLRHVEER